MTKSKAFMLPAAVVITLFFAVGAIAQETVTLAIKGTPGKILKYKAEVGGSLSFNLESLPLPNSSMTGDNLMASVTAEAYFDTIEATDDYNNYEVRLMMGDLILGGLLQLPDFSGEGKIPTLNMDITPQGAIENIQVSDFEMPGGGGDMLKGMIPGMDSMGLDLTSMDTIMPMITGLIPPMFPTTPVAVGDKWAQKISEENMPMPIFPIFEFRYKLDSIEDGVARIKYRTKGDYDAAFLNNFLAMMPEIPMGDDTMSIDKVDLVASWDISGIMHYLVDEGLIKDMKSEGAMEIKGGGSLTFTHPDGSAEPWNPALKANVNLNMNLDYLGEVERAAFEELFPPPPPPEEEEDAGEAGEPGGEPGSAGSAGEGDGADSAGETEETE